MKNPIFALSLRKGNEKVPFFYKVMWMIERLLSEALTAKFLEEEYQDCYLVDIVVKKNDRVEVYIDSDTTLTIRICQRISRHLEHLIEENGWLGDKYTLEVSSPGVDRPLKLKRQYVKNLGRRIRIVTDEEETIEGKLLNLQDDVLTVSISKDATTEINMENIKKAKILVSFK